MLCQSKTGEKTQPRGEKLKKRVSIIIPAGGKGTRFGEDKQLFQIGGKPIVQRTIEVFTGLELVDQIIVVTNDERREQILSWDINFDLTFALDGKERYNSVYNGLKEVKYEIVGIHDGARCLITSELIMDCLDVILEKKADAVFLGIKPVDTIRLYIGENEYIELPRSDLLAVQTPQVFRTALILNAFERFFKDPKKDVTDDINIFRNYIPITEGRTIHVEGDISNIKVTHPRDIVIAEEILRQRGEL
ncbi:2-C-methyl-D-erythritol 4-phosphate cytidylyltransferase [Candidatus Micrarchaeota archaeon]|nr:2-C-methyl-D-erythritol 4-phosphate cytidylyltransferase [Candidatus Micrarchaeota archaeon]